MRVEVFVSSRDVDFPDYVDVVCGPYATVGTEQLYYAEVPKEYIEDLSNCEGILSVQEESDNGGAC